MAFVDRTMEHINSLSPKAAALAFQFINDLRSAGIPAYISSSRRTARQQATLVKAGKSQTLNSKHLSGLAFDVDVLGWGRNQLPKAFWLALGSHAESLGMKWGGRWTSFYDAGHFEI